jgi:hypothetical protein
MVDDDEDDDDDDDDVNDSIERGKCGVNAKVWISVNSEARSKAATMETIGDRSFIII